MDLQTLLLLRRFPGILGEIGATAARMAEAAGRRGPWVWYDVQSRREGGYVAFVFGQMEGQAQPVRFPVGHDAAYHGDHSPEPVHPVRMDDEPHVFFSPLRAEAAAREAADRLYEQLVRRQRTGQ